MTVRTRATGAPPGPLRSRAALAVLVLVGLLSVPILLAVAPSAAAAPEDRPIEVRIDSVTPTTAAPDQPIRISGRLTNAGPDLVEGLTLRPQRGPVLTTRTEIAAAVSDPGDDTDATVPFTDLPEPLAPGDDVPFVLDTSAEELDIAEDGSYSILINVNGEVGNADPSRVGELRFLLPYLQTPPTARVALSWLWPVVAAPTRITDGTFLGDGLAEDLEPGGALDRLLAEVEQGRPVAPPGGGAPRVEPLPVTLAIDPQLVEAVGVMAEGDYSVLVAGADGAQPAVVGSSAGTEDALSWLARLRTLAGSLPVIALTYADPDIAGLASGGQLSAVERLLPDGAVGDSLPDLLGVEPEATIAWPSADAGLDPGVLELLTRHGADTVIADNAAFEPNDDGDYPPTAARIVGSPATALVGDTVLRQVLARASADPSDLVPARQRLLAELSTAALDGAGSSGSAAPEPASLLVAPEHDIDPAVAGELLRTALGQGWIDPVQVPELPERQGDPAAARVVAPPSGGAAIPVDQLTQVLSALAIRDQFASAVPDPDTVLATFDRALGRAAAVTRGSDPARMAAVVADAVDRTAALNQSVGLIAPANGSYSLASQDAPLALTVFNNNPFPVQVMVTLSPRESLELELGQVRQEIGPNARTQVEVPVSNERSGRFTVIATVATPTASPLGAPVQLQVQSTGYGPVALAITFAASGLLALLFLRRSVRYWRRRSARGGAADRVRTGPRARATDQRAREDIGDLDGADDPDVLASAGPGPGSTVAGAPPGRGAGSGSDTDSGLVAPPRSPV